ncbi:MAG: PH domain-containing protein [Woeseiaceae bacterium]|nr:PH domain-containing protein [Woeseiaceae bacterium]
MSQKHFKSKVDRWLFMLLVASIVIDIAAVLFIAVNVRDPLIAAVSIIVLLATAVLIAWILVGTRYTVDKEILRIVSGPLRFKVRLADINSVTATRNPLSSPALSLDRLLIKYGNNRKVMVSPDDKRRFLKAIGQELEEDRNRD